MLDDLVGACAEAAAGAERASERSDDHVYFGWVDVLVLRETTAGTTYHAEGPALVENEAELVAESEFDLESLAQYEY